MKFNNPYIKIPKEYLYYINLDERGEFYADVRDENGNTIFEIKGFKIFEDGFMKDKNDVQGLYDHLLNRGMIEVYDTIATV